MKEIMELLNRAFKGKISIKEEQKTYRIMMDGTSYPIPDREALKTWIQNQFDLKILSTKKEVHQKLLSLSELYLTMMKKKDARNLLIESIPSIEKVVAVFFDMSKYCSNEHIFDGFTVEHIGYDDFLSLAPGILSHLKDRRRLEKIDEIKHYFDDCETIKNCFLKIEKLKKDKMTYQTVCTTLDDFFKFYQISKNEIEITQKGPFTYDSLFQLFLEETVILKQQEINEEISLYQKYLKEYQEIQKKITILEVTPSFKEIKKTDSLLRKQKERISKEEKEIQNNLNVIEQHKKECQKDQKEWNNKGFLHRMFTSKTKKNLELEMSELNDSYHEMKGQMEEVKKNLDGIKKEMTQNEKLLSKQCNFHITISDFDEKVKAYTKEGITMKQLEEELQEKETQLLRFHIEKKEAELDDICSFYHIKLPNKEKA